MVKHFIHLEDEWRQRAPCYRRKASIRLKFSSGLGKVTIPRSPCRSEIEAVHSEHLELNSVASDGPKDAMCSTNIQEGERGLESSSCLSCKAPLPKVSSSLYSNDCIISILHEISSSVAHFLIDQRVYSLPHLFSAAVLAPSIEPSSSLSFTPPLTLIFTYHIALTTYLTDPVLRLPFVRCSYRDVAMTPPDWSFRLLDVPHLPVSIPTAVPTEADKINTNQSGDSIPTGHTSMSGLSLPTYPKVHLLGLPHEVRVSIWRTIYNDVGLGALGKWYQKPTTKW